MQEPNNNFAKLNQGANTNGNGAKNRENMIIPQFAPLSVMAETANKNVMAVEEESIDFKQIFNIVKRRWSIISSVAIGLTAAVGFWTYQQPSVYEGKFSMLVEDSSNPTGSSSQNSMASFWLCF